MFIAAWLIGGFMTEGYSLTQDPISDLAASGAKTRVLMTLGLMAFAVGVGSAAWPLSWLIGRSAAIALIINAVSTLGVAFTPVGRSAAVETWHGEFAGVAYLTLTATGLLASKHLWRRSRSLSLISLVIGLATGLYLYLSTTGSSQGLFQRLGLTTTDLWLMLMAYLGLANTDYN